MQRGAPPIPGDVCMVTNKPGGVLYIGVSSQLAVRIAQHRSRAVPGFTKAYNCHRLVWFECFENLEDARAFETQMKGGTGVEGSAYRRAQSALERPEH